MRNLKINSKRIVSIGVTSLLLASIVTGCGNSNSSKNAADSSLKRAAVEKSNDRGYVNNEIAAEDIADNSDSTDSNNEKKDVSTNKLNTEKLIYKCDINIETLKFADTITEFQKLVSKYDAFIETEKTYTDDSYTYDDYDEYYDGSYDYSYRNDYGLGYYTATVRVPASKYNDFVNDTDGIGTLKNKSQNVTNVSQEYSDLTVELEVLEAQKDDYLSMLKEAKSLKDMDNVIKISDKIASVNTEINKIKTRLNTIDNDVAYSFVTVTISEVKEIVEHSEDTFMTRFKREVKQGWYDFGFGLQNFFIDIVANIWNILTFFGIIIIGFLIARKIVKKINSKMNSTKITNSNTGAGTNVNGAYYNGTKGDKTNK
ncbi:MAG: DUF4349 domain-containing protein [Lachnospiraceae bacterium]|nr:DUF4349 domain-containing protein [Lachnospiraceae bacterium]